MRLRSWGTFAETFVGELSTWIGERKVLEVFAGNGLLASKLAAKGVDVLATSLYKEYDGSRRDFPVDVYERDARDAVIEFGEGRDLLLMCWPTTTEAAAASALLWGQDRPIVFIGEVTDLARGHYGGCATDLFFDMTEEMQVFSTYRSEKSGLDRAAIRKTRPNALELWCKARDEAILKTHNPLGFKSIRGFH